MSKTDNTRPWWLQYADPTVEGYVHHQCTKRRGRKRSHSYSIKLSLECDYGPGNNLYNYRLAHTQAARWRSVARSNPRECTRVTYRYGGKNSAGGCRAKCERKQRRRRLRQRERAALHQVLGSRNHDFDLLPIREDNRTIYYDLT